jgi:hypothetical protein
MIRHKNQVAGICASGAALMLAVFPAAMSQAKPAQESIADSADSATESTDHRKKSLRVLRSEYYSAEEDFYDLFNSINSTDEFDVVCQDEVPFGVRKKVHTCKAAFLLRYEDKLASKYSNRMSRIGEDSLPSTSQIDEKQEQLRNEISSAVNNNPEMQKLYVILVNAKKDYEARQQDP